ncbi:MAG TPA: glycosyltransferase [Chitinophagales bacterium]|nr:glycosyltransferase [Chitinophagales bacterium]
MLKDPKVIALVVTYADRWSQVKACLNALNKEPLVARVILVDNASTYSIQEPANEQELRKTTVLSMPANTGSAGGFRAGLEYISLHFPDLLVLLLDDDNLLAEGLLEQLLLVHASMIGDKTGAVFPYRPERPYMRSVMQGKKVYEALPMKNSFYGFHWKKLWYKLFHINGQKRFGCTGKICSLPFAPYGGMLFRAADLQVTGLPDPAYFVYMDDFDFSYRFIQEGGKLLMISDVTMLEEGENWQEEAKSSSRVPRVLRDQGWRNLINLRNNAYFSRHRLADSTFVFLLNMWTFRSLLFLMALVSGHLKSWKKVEANIRSGLRGELGRPSNLTV